MVFVTDRNAKMAHPPYLTFLCCSTRGALLTRMPCLKAPGREPMQGLKSKPNLGPVALHDALHHRSWAWP